MEEIWKDAVGYEKYFMISNLGRVYSKRTDRILKTVIHKLGYEVFSTKIGGRASKAILLRVHRLVAEAFINNSENKPFVNHKDDIKTNNHVNNLEWVTAGENTRHARDTDLLTIRCGLDNHASKLNLESITKIFKESIRTTGTKSSRELAKELNINKSAINNILNGVSYKDEVALLRSQGHIV